MSPNVYLLEFSKGILYKAAFPPFVKVNGLNRKLEGFEVYEDNSIKNLRFENTCELECDILIDSSVRNPPYQGVLTGTIVVKLLTTGN